MAYIYKITNLTNNKLYIGKTSRDIKTRWEEHLRHSISLPNIPLYRAINKYGKENFIIEQIEECNDEIVNEREIFWINFYNTYKNGYNCTLGGEGSLLNYDEAEIQEIIMRYQNGERLDLLCKEFHHKYDSIRSRLIERGIKINTHAGPMKQAKKIYAINPITLQIEKSYSSISEAARSICPEGKNYKSIANHISKYKNTKTISHGYLWKTELM